MADLDRHPDYTDTVTPEERRMLEENDGCRPMVNIVGVTLLLALSFGAVRCVMETYEANQAADQRADVDE